MVIPPDGKDRSGRYQWQVINPAGSGGTVELVDDPTKALGQGEPLAPGAAPFTAVMAGNDQLWALGPASGTPVVVEVVGTEYAEE